jgi:hypothetical protein
MKLIKKITSITKPIKTKGDDYADGVTGND